VAAPLLTLDLDGPRVTVDRFLHALDGLLTILQEVDREMTRRPKGSLRFVITEMYAASAHLQAVAEPAIEAPPLPPIRIVEAAAHGLAVIELGGDRPPYFTDRALQAATAIARAVDEEEVTAVRIRFGEQVLGVSRRLGAHAEDLVRGTLRSLGSVEGRLEVLSVHQRTHATIYDSVTGRAVRCLFPEDELPLVMGAFGRRVMAHGLIWSNAQGEARTIDVRSAGDLVVFPRDEDLPRAGEVRGLLRG
jgi:hypothetical protein